MGRWLPWLVGGALSLQLFYTDFTHSNGGALEGKAFWGRDFVNLWAGGRFLDEHAASALYRVEEYRAFLATLFGPLKPHNYSYPPVTFPIAQLFALVPYWLALALWLAGTGALFVWAARCWWPRPWGPPALALLTPAALMNIWAGHYGFLLGALFLLGWARLDRRPVEAGVFFGLMLIKPHLALLVPVALAIRGRWTAIGSAAVTVVVLIVASIALYGIGPWREFLFGTSAVQAGLIDAGGSFYGFMSTSTATAMFRLSDSWLLATVAQAAMVALGLIGVIVAATRHVPTERLAMLVATGTFLVLPYAFNYDLTVVCIAALRLWADADATRGERLLAIGGFVAPQIGLLLAPLALPATPLMLAGLFIAQLRVSLRSSARQPQTLIAPRENPGVEAL